MSAGCVIVEPGAPIWRVTLNRPEQGNALSAELVAGLDAAFEDAAAAGAQALVLQGAGRHFCTGFDLSGVQHETDDTLLARFVRIELMLQRVHRAPFLTVAIAHGRTMGAGADLFAACELRLAQAGASFAFPGARGFGLVLGTRRLAQRVGAGAGLDWVESGRVIDTDEALARGLATGRVEAPSDADALVESRALADSALAGMLRSAAFPCATLEDAHDLECLIRSAARPGLRDRVAAYVARAAAARVAAAASSPSSQRRNMPTAARSGSSGCTK